MYEGERERERDRQTESETEREKESAPHAESGPIMSNFEAILTDVLY